MRAPHSTQPPRWPVASGFEVQPCGDDIYVLRKAYLRRAERLAEEFQPALGELELFSGVNGPKVLVNLPDGSLQHEEVCSSGSIAAHRVS
jgi:hypothetical protein